MHVIRHEVSSHPSRLTNLKKPEGVLILDLDQAKHLETCAQLLAILDISPCSFFRYHSAHSRHVKPWKNGRTSVHVSCLNLQMEITRRMCACLCVLPFTVRVCHESSLPLQLSCAYL